MPMSQTLSRLCALLFALIYPASVFGQGNAPGIRESVLVLTHISIVDVSEGDAKRALHPEQTLLIEGSRIVAIGSKIRIPPDARVIDAKGKFLIPGLWDMHVHSLFEGRTEFFFPLFIANGVTGVREMSSTLAPEEIQQIRRRIENGEVIGPRIGLSAVRTVEGKANRG